ncbi:hypothetical protein D3C80_1789970 [compost metagenome]
MEILNILICRNDSFDGYSNIFSPMLRSDIAADYRRDILNAFNISKRQRLLKRQGGCRSAPHNVNGQLVGTQRT